MKILARKEDDFVICLLPDGRAVQIVMLGANGEDVYAKPNIDEAIKILLAHLPTLLPAE